MKKILNEWRNYVNETEATEKKAALRSSRRLKARSSRLTKTIVLDKITNKVFKQLKEKKGRVTKSQLGQLIKEEIKTSIEEGNTGLWGSIKGTFAPGEVDGIIKQYAQQLDKFREEFEELQGESFDEDGAQDLADKIDAWQMRVRKIFYDASPSAAQEKRYKRWQQESQEMEDEVQAYKDRAESYRDERRGASRAARERIRGQEEEERSDRYDRDQKRYRDAERKKKGPYGGDKKDIGKRGDIWDAFE